MQIGGFPPSLTQRKERKKRFANFQKILYLQTLLVMDKTNLGFMYFTPVPLEMGRVLKSSQYYALHI